MVEEEGKQDEEKLDFTPEGETLGYISLDQARVLAMRTAKDSPGAYGEGFQNVLLAFELIEAEETEDHYVITLSVQPQSQFSRRLVREQVFVEKGGSVAYRQVLPILGRGSHIPILPTAIGLLVVGGIAAIAAVFTVGCSGGDNAPPASPTVVLAPTRTTASVAVPPPAPANTPPAPTLTPVPTPTVAPTAVPTFVPANTRVPVAPTTVPPASTADGGRDTAAGQAVFTKAGCVGCHTIQGISTGMIGPELTNVATNAATRIAGMSAEAYIRQSEEEPGAFLVEGFGPLMPSLREVMTDDEFEDLIAFLMTQNTGAIGTSKRPTAATVVGQNGNLAPDFEFTLFQGESVLGDGDRTLRLSDLQGKPVVVNFWAGLLPPSRAEMPDLQEFYKEFVDRVTLIGIDLGQFTGLGSVQDAEDLLEELEITYPAGFTNDASVIKKYRILGMPTTIFIDANGVVFKDWRGALNADVLRAQANAMLSQ